MRLIENLVFNNNRILYGFLILLTVLISFFFNLDNLFFSLLVILVIYDLHKSLFIYKMSLLIFLFFSFLSLTVYKIFPNQFSFFLILSFSMTVISVLTFKKILKISFILSLLFFFIILFMLSNSFREIFYMIFFISFLNDSVAYIFGKTLKGPLIISQISPKKTWSGTMISLFISSFILFVLGYGIFIAFIFSLSLFIGDIFFSLIKRQLFLKDFSNVLSSHGGILDRLDSMFFAVPLFYIYYFL